MKGAGIEPADYTTAPPLLIYVSFTQSKTYIWAILVVTVGFFCERKCTSNEKMEIERFETKTDEN